MQSNSKHNSLIIMVVLLGFMSCCTGDRGPVKRSWGRMKGLEKVVGNMNDDSYSTGRTQEPRLDALGEPVAMTDFEGKFVWAEYAATWCTVCAKQTPETKKIKNQFADDIVFITVMTGKGTRYNDHATVDTAKLWASRFGLDPKRVLAAKLWFKTVPEHRLFSPQGHTLFVHVGFLSADQISKVIDYYKPGWENWSRSGKQAEWMIFK